MQLKHAIEQKREHEKYFQEFKLTVELKRVRSDDHVERWKKINDFKGEIYRMTRTGRIACVDDKTTIVRRNELDETSRKEITVN